MSRKRDRKFYYEVAVPLLTDHAQECGDLLKYIGESAYWSHYWKDIVFAEDRETYIEEVLGEVMHEKYERCK